MPKSNSLNKSMRKLKTFVNKNKDYIASEIFYNLPAPLYVYMLEATFKSLFLSLDYEEAAAQKLADELKWPACIFMSVSNYALFKAHNHETINFYNGLTETKSKSIFGLGTVEFIINVLAALITASFAWLSSLKEDGFDFLKYFYLISALGLFANVLNVNSDHSIAKGKIHPHDHHHHGLNHSHGSHHSNGLNHSHGNINQASGEPNTLAVSILMKTFMMFCWTFAAISHMGETVFDATQTGKDLLSCSRFKNDSYSLVDCKNLEDEFFKISMMLGLVLGIAVGIKAFFVERGEMLHAIKDHGFKGWFKQNLNIFGLGNLITAFIFALPGVASIMATQLDFAPKVALSLTLLIADTFIGSFVHGKFFQIGCEERLHQAKACLTWMKNKLVQKPVEKVPLFDSNPHITA